ncbi:MAG: hypothetical protein C4297_03745 [Gemmataceae bacterium]
MHLDWGNRARQSRYWHLPNGVVLSSRPPQVFGIDILREDADRYRVWVVWDDSVFGWQSLSRQQISETDLGDLLFELGTDLELLLSQPIARCVKAS